jgi:hypothetical protein
VVAVIKSIYDKYIVVEYAKDGWVHRIAVEPDDFDPSEDPIGRG